MFKKRGFHQKSGFEHFLLVASNIAAKRGSSNFIEIWKLPDNCDECIDEDQACLDVDARFPAVKILADLSIVISIVFVKPKHHKT